MQHVWVSREHTGFGQKKHIKFFRHKRISIEDLPKWKMDKDF